MVFSEILPDEISEFFDQRSVREVPGIGGAKTANVCPQNGALVPWMRR